MIKRLKKIFGIGPKPVPPFEKRELEIPLYNEFKNHTKLLEDKLPGLGIEIKGYEEKLEKVKTKYGNNAKKKNELENKLKIEKRSLKWFDEEVKRLNETKENIIERAQNVITDFTNQYCSKITKQLDNSINEIRKYPHPHEKNIDDLKRKIDDVGISVSDLFAEISQLNYKISTVQETREYSLKSIEKRKEFDFTELSPPIEKCEELNNQLNEIKTNKKNVGSSINNDELLESYEKINDELLESIEVINNLIKNFSDNHELEPEESGGKQQQPPPPPPKPKSKSKSKSKSEKSRSYFPPPSTMLPAPYNNGVNHVPYKYQYGVMNYHGYKTGRNGEHESIRREILEWVYSHPFLPEVNNEKYMQEWDAPDSEERLKRIVKEIVNSITSAKKLPNNYSLEIDDWIEDLAYLKKGIYDENQFTFEWPDIKLQN